MLTEPNKVGDWLKYEQDEMYSRKEVTVLSGQNLKSGTVVGRVGVGAVTVAAIGTPTGNGALGTWIAGDGAKDGDYILTCIEPASNAGKFSVADPDGIELPPLTVAVAYTGPINGTIADGATDWASGDQIRVRVAAGSSKVKASPNADDDGSAEVAGILLYDVDASAADKRGVIIDRGAKINPLNLIYDASVDDATKKAAKLAQLEALGFRVLTAA